MAQPAAPRLAFLGRYLATLGIGPGAAFAAANGPLAGVTVLVSLSGVLPWIGRCWFDRGLS